MRSSVTVSVKPQETQKQYFDSNVFFFFRDNKTTAAIVKTNYKRVVKLEVDIVSK